MNLTIDYRVGLWDQNRVVQREVGTGGPDFKNTLNNKYVYLKALLIYLAQFCHYHQREWPYWV